MIKLSKTLHNMASRRGIVIDVVTLQDRIGRDFEALDIGNEEYPEVCAFYRISDDGFYFDCASWQCEDWPGWIRDEAHLRTLLDDMSAELKS